jgi:LmbE family N-acetylglucosaminyl deacetylase
VRILGVHDGELENDVQTRAEVVRSIRELRPTTVVSCDPTAWFFENRYYNHSDHRTAGIIALDAVFPGAGNPHFFSEHLSEGLGPHSASDVWLGWTNEPTHREEITGFLQTKIDALAAHASQLAEGIAFFEEELERKAREAGAQRRRARGGVPPPRTVLGFHSGREQHVAPVVQRSANRSANATRARQEGVPPRLPQHRAHEPPGGPRAEPSTYSSSA